MNESRRARELHARGDLRSAEPLYRSALAAHPGDLPLRRDFCSLLMQSGREREAIALVDQPDVLGRADADLLLMLALCLRRSGMLNRALEISKRINRLSPSDAGGWLLRGSIQMHLGEHKDAESALRECIALEPGSGEAWHYLGESLQAQRRWDEAIAAYTISARSQPAEIFNIATCHEQAGRIRNAMEDYQSAHRLLPSRADVLARLAQTQTLLCLHDEAAATTAALARVLRKPLADDDVPEPFILSYLGIDEDLKSASLHRSSQRILRATAPLREPAARPARGHRPVRLGYISADFGPHAVGELVRSHFAAHDRSRVRVSGYSLHSHSGSIADEISLGFDSFRDCSGLGDAAVAQAIRTDGIDVLIDLSGFTGGGRPNVLALRPAPLQLGWLGFIHGHNAPWLDGLLMDEHLVPSGAEWPYEDTIIRLPGTLFPGSPKPPGKRDRGKFSLPDDAPVLASFNNSYKLTAELIQAWCTILQQAPRAHLLVYLPEPARPGFLRVWRSFSGPAGRLHLADKLSIEEHSDRAASCDLFLDAFRYQGGATSMNAVQNGLPVLAVAGATPLARLSVSINRFLGLEELVCRNAQDYVRRAVALANEPSKLQELRERLRSNVIARGLFNPRRSAAVIEETVFNLFG